MDVSALKNNIVFHIFIIGFFLISGLFLATKLGYIHCSAVPGWCDIYLKIMNMISPPYPKILILYGDSGTGNPDKLKHILEQTCKISVEKRNIKLISESEIMNKDVIIVEHAKYIDSDTLRLLAKFVGKGGKLIWVGNAGVQFDANEIPDQNLCKDPNAIGNPWARKIYINGQPKCLKFYELLGAKYIGTINHPTYVDLVKVEQDILTRHMLRYKLYTQFSIVRDLKYSIFGTHNYLAKIDTDFDFNNIRGPYPGILKSARVYYFAFPIEDLVKEVDPDLNYDYSVMIKDLCLAVS